MQNGPQQAEAIVQTPTVFLLDPDPALNNFMTLCRASALQVSRFNEASELLNNLRPDSHGCLIVDTHRAGVSIQALRSDLQLRGIALPIIVHTTCAQIEDVVRAMKAGAMDLLTKPTDNLSLLASVKTAIEFDRGRLRRARRLAAIEGHLRLLTVRERQIVDLIVSGLGTKQIAVELKLCPKTVENHRSRILDKLEAKGVVDLVRMVCEAQIIRNHGELQL